MTRMDYEPRIKIAVLLEQAAQEVGRAIFDLDQEVKSLKQQCKDIEQKRVILEDTLRQKENVIAGGIENFGESLHKFLSDSSPVFAQFNILKNTLEEQGISFIPF